MKFQGLSGSDYIPTSSWNELWGLLKQFQRKGATLFIEHLTVGSELHYPPKQPVSRDTHARLVGEKPEVQGKALLKAQPCQKVPGTVSGKRNRLGQASSRLCNQSHYLWSLAKKTPRRSCLAESNGE